MQDELARLQATLLDRRCEEAAPAHYLCTGSKELMLEPVIAEDGYPYNRAWMAKYIRDAISSGNS